MKLIGYNSDYAYGDLQKEIYNLVQGKKHRNKKLSHKPKSGHCCYCCIELNKHNYTRDHIYPKSLGGRVTKPCCKACNQEKGNKTLIEYAQFIGKKMYEMDKRGERDTLGFRLCTRKMSKIEQLMTLKPDQK